VIGRDIDRSPMSETGAAQEVPTSAPVLGIEPGSTAWEAGLARFQDSGLARRFRADLRALSKLDGSLRLGPIWRDAVGFGQQIRLLPKPARTT